MCNSCGGNEVVDPDDETVCALKAECSREEFFVIESNKCNPC